MLGLQNKYRAKRVKRAFKEGLNIRLSVRSFEQTFKNATIKNRKNIAFCTCSSILLSFIKMKKVLLNGCVFKFDIFGFQYTILKNVKKK